MIVGARNEEQLADNLAAVSLELTAEEAERIDVASRPHLPYPLWHQVASASERLGSGRPGRSWRRTCERPSAP